EVAKLALRQPGSAGEAAARQVLRFVLDTVLRLLHPFMPFITEEIWQRLHAGEGGEPSIMRAPWPAPLAGFADPGAEHDLALVRDVVSAIRSFRADHHIESGARMRVALTGADARALEALDRERAVVEALGRVQIETAEAPGGGPETRVVAGAVDILIRLGDILDLDAERARLGKALERAEAEVTRFETKLGNESFRAKAPAEVVAAEERKLAEAHATQAKLRAQLEELA
ncbi:MAG TPA: class I tRNA ligase family protein, partial [Acidimicrobiia bacterium]|nr:class I tRNA ligase family protein [Acidimicrobiia bacterium]